QPSSVVTYRYGSVTFTNVAIGSLPMTFQWQFNGTNLPNATNTTLSYANALPLQAGDYSIVVSNEFGVATSTNATLILLQVRDNGNATYNSSQYSVPLSLTNDVQAMAAGTFHSLVLKSNGTLITWGTTVSGLQNVPASATDIIAIAAGGTNSLVLRSNGTVVEWGDNTSGQTNIPPGLSNVVAISVGDFHSLALRQDGTVVSWGSNASGQTNVPASATNIIAIAAGGAHSLALRSNGTLIAWGTNVGGPTNIPATATNVMAIAAAGNHNIILRKDGSTLTWGNSTLAFFPNTNIVAVGTGGFSGSYYSILRGDGTVTGGFVTSVSNAVAIATGGAHNLVLLGDGSPVIYLPPYSFPAARPGDTVSTRVNTSGTGPITYQWQLNGTNIVGATNAILTLTNIPITFAGAYRCVVSSAYGTTISAETTLSITRFPLLFSTAANVTQLTTNGFKFRVTGLAGQGPVIVYASTNLADWSPVLTNSPLVGTLDLVDPNATAQPQGFYKVSEGP
ncbi:MAG: hypothetical protein JWM68_2212, partial [Verrucomicrobiales bacterium]|nr:hypothetical protein [Verrucomicrobiales bacterium]